MRFSCKSDNLDYLYRNVPTNTPVAEVMRSKLIDSWPERADFRPQRADFRPERAWKGLMYKGTDKRKSSVFFRAAALEA